MWHQLREGCLANLPLGVSVASYGSVMGVLAAQKHIDLITVLSMNVLIFAGAAQFVMVDMWLPPLPVIEITLAVLAINLRYLLIGASLRPVFAGSRLWQKLTVMHFVADENWAVTMKAHREGGSNIFFLLGGGICLGLFWSGGTAAGHLFGSVIRHPERYALDFAFVAVFTALTTSLWRGRRDWLPWLVAALLAIVSAKLLPGKYYIVIGGIGGALVNALPMYARDQRRTPS